MRVHVFTWSAGIFCLQGYISVNTPKVIGKTKICFYRSNFLDTSLIQTTYLCWQNEMMNLNKFQVNIKNERNTRKRYLTFSEEFKLEETYFPRLLLLSSVTILLLTASDFAISFSNWTAVPSKFCISDLENTSEYLFFFLEFPAISQIIASWWKKKH